MRPILQHGDGNSGCYKIEAEEKKFFRLIFVLLPLLTGRKRSGDFSVKTNKVQMQAVTNVEERKQRE